jgi:hypothetical protein
VASLPLPAAVKGLLANLLALLSTAAAQCQLRVYGLGRQGELRRRQRD